MMRYLTRTVLGLGAALLLASCDMPSGGPRIGQGPVSVALLVPANSEDVRVNNLADTLIAAANLAISDADASRIQLSIFPTQGTVEGARRAAQLALESRAKVVVGPLYADNAVAVGQVLSGSGIPIISFSNNPQIAGGNVYALGQSFEDTATRILSYAKSQGRSRVIAVVPEGASGEVATAAISNAASLTGVTFAGRASYEFSQQGVQRGAPEIVAQINSTGSDIAILSANPAGALPLLAQSLGDADLNTSRTRVAGLARWDVPASTLSLVTLQEGLFALPNVATSTDFASRFESFAGIPPQLVTGVSYDAMTIVTSRLAAGGSSPFARDQLLSDTYSGASGTFRIAESGQARRELAIAQVRETSYEVVSQTQISEAGF